MAFYRAALVAEEGNATAEDIGDPIVVTSPTGSVSGVDGTDWTEMGTKIYKFKGIPYAEPPVGELRLRDPVPVQPWAGVREGADDP